MKIGIGIEKRNTSRKKAQNMNPFDTNLQSVWCLISSPSEEIEIEFDWNMENRLLNISKVFVLGKPPQFMLESLLPLQRKIIYTEYTDTAKQLHCLRVDFYFKEINGWKSTRNRPDICSKLPVRLSTADFLPQGWFLWYKEFKPEESPPLSYLARMNQFYLDSMKLVDWNWFFSCNRFVLVEMHFEQMNRTDSWINAQQVQGWLH